LLLRSVTRALGSAPVPRSCALPRRAHRGLVLGRRRLHPCRHEPDGLYRAPDALASQGSGVPAQPLPDAVGVIAGPRSLASSVSLRSAWISGDIVCGPTASTTSTPMRASRRCCLDSVRVVTGPSHSGGRCGGGYPFFAVLLRTVRRLFGREAVSDGDRRSEYLRSPALRRHRQSDTLRARPFRA